MKKITLLLFTIFAYSFNANAQDTCATATAITPGTFTVNAVNGTEAPNPECAANAGSAAMTAAEWYTFTPTVSGSATITTDLPANVAPFSNDTRVHIFTGACGALTCVGGNDDVSGTNYLSNATWNIISGTTYTIAFDNRWSALGFDFELTEVVLSCLDPSAFITNSLTSTELDLSWTDDNTGTPTWDIEYGLTGFTLGTGTMATGLTTTNYVFSGLTPNTNYEFYITTNCGVVNGFSNQIGPIAIRSLRDCTLPTSFPYSESFADGTILDCWLLEDTDGISPVWTYNTDINDINGDEINDSFMVMFPQAAGETTKDDWLFSSKIDMTTQNQYNISVAYNAFDFNGTVSNESFDLVVVDAQTSTAVFQSVLNSYSGITQSGAFGDAGGNDLITQAYTAMESFVPPSDGEYYIAIHATTTGTNSASLLMVFNLSIDATLSIDEFDTNSFSHSYNKNTQQLTIESTNLPFDGIELYSLLGQKIIDKKLSQTTEMIDISQLTKGVYLATVKINGSSKTIKFVKN
jgi:hypothetical protein